MKVIHIIPNVFNYFEDIRSEAFLVTEWLPKLGVQADMFTLQYGAPSAGKVEQSERSTETPSQSETPTPQARSFVGLNTIDELIDSLSEYDSVHLHVPFLGAAHRIIAWKKVHPEIPLVITYYRNVRTPDLFSLFIKWYNAYYLPKLFAISNVVAFRENTWFLERQARKFQQPGKETKPFVPVDETFEFAGKSLLGVSDRVTESGVEAVALKYAILYNQFQK